MTELANIGNLNMRDSALNQALEDVEKLSHTVAELVSSLEVDLHPVLEAGPPEEQVVDTALRVSRTPLLERLDSIGHQLALTRDAVTSLRGRLVL